MLGYLRCQHPSHAEDLLAETFLGAVRDIHGFSGGESEFRRWILRIARNRLIDLRRAERVRPSVTVANVPEQAHEESAIERVEAADAAGRGLEQLLEPLSPDQRAVLYLRYVLDLDQRDTAMVLGTSLAAVKMTQRRGLDKLGAQMKRGW